MKSGLRRLAVWSWYLAALVLVLSASLVSLGQYYFPYLGEYREPLLRRAAAELPFGIEITGLNAEWTGLAPTFHVQGLRLYARNEPAVTILSSSRCEIRIDILRSLFSLAPRLRKIVAENVALEFLEMADGSWRMAGVGDSRSRSNPEEIIAFFLAIEEIELHQTRLLLKARSSSAGFLAAYSVEIEELCTSFPQLTHRLSAVECPFNPVREYYSSRIRSMARGTIDYLKPERQVIYSTFSVELPAPWLALQRALRRDPLLCRSRPPRCAPHRVVRPSGARGRARVARRRPAAAPFRSRSRPAGGRRCAAPRPRRAARRSGRRPRQSLASKRSLSRRRARRAARTPPSHRTARRCS